MSTAAPAALGVRLRRATWALAAREMRRVLSLWTQTLLPPVITGLIFLAIFGGALGDRLETLSDVSYTRFILPGLLVMTVAAQAFGNTATSLFQAKSEGYIEDILTSPLRPPQIVLAYMAGGLLRGWLAALALALVAAPSAGAPHDALLLLAALLLCGLLFAALGVIVGIWADSFDQHAFIANLVISPLALLGGVFYAADRLDEPWQSVTRIDPLYYIVDATRQGWTGIHETAPTAALLLALIVTAALYAIAVALVQRGWRLKP